MAQGNDEQLTEMSKKTKKLIKSRKPEKNNQENRIVKKTD
jgi:hypothetical protein